MPEDELSKKGLRHAEEEWARGWIQGVARVLAEMPPGEDNIAQAQRTQQIMAIAEHSPEVVEYAKRWRTRLLEALER